MTVRGAFRLLLAGSLGAGCALLVACGSGKSLIPSTDAGPLSSDFDAIARAVSNGDCAATRTALAQAQHDFNALPSSVDAGLRQRISDGLNNLQSTAPTQCAQAQSQTQSTQATTTQATTTQTTTTTTPPPSTSQTTTTPPPTTTTGTGTGTTGTTTTPAQTTGQGGGTPAPGGNGAGGALPGQGQ
jgi:cell division septation protein DedD